MTSEYSTSRKYANIWFSQSDCQLGKQEGTFTANKSDPFSVAGSQKDMGLDRACLSSVTHQALKWILLGAIDVETSRT